MEACSRCVKLEAQVGALRHVLTVWNQPTGTGVTVGDAERMAQEVLTDTEAAAHAYTAQVRRAALEEAAHLVETWCYPNDAELSATLAAAIRAAAEADDGK